MKKLIMLGITFFGMTINVAIAKDNDEEIVQKGTISALSESVITVSAVDFLLTGSTEYENAQDHHVSRTFFSIGDYVKVKGYLASGILVAKEVELESNNNSNNKNGGDKSANSNIRLRDKLVKEPGVTNGVGGWIRFIERGKNGRVTTRFAAKLEIPVPSDLPLVEDQMDAQGILVEVELKRADGTPYAQCEFDYDRLKDRDDNLGSSQIKAEYKIDVRLINKYGDLTRRQKKGSCFASNTTEQIVPQVQTGDTADIFADGILVMTGTL